MKQLKLKDLGLKKINTIAVSVTGIMCAIFIVSFFTINGFIASVANAALPACNTAAKGTLTKHDGAVVYCDGISWNGVGAEGTGGDFWEDAGSGKIYYSEGLVGVNTTDPKTALDVDGTLVSNDAITAKKITFGAGGITLQDVADSECTGADDAGRVRYNSTLKRIEVCNTVSFEPVDGDIIPPYLLSSNPLDDAVNAVITQNILLGFNEPVNLDSGFITIFNALDDSVFESFTSTSPQLSGDGTNQITLNPTSNFAVGQEYYVLISSTLFVDENDNYFAGIDDKDTLNFITADPSPPSHLSFFPVDDSIDAVRNSNLIITFNEPIKAGSGGVEIRRTSDNALVESISISSNQISGYNSSVITINPSANLPSFTNIYVLIPAGAFQDIAGNSYAGVINPADWNFVTEDSGPPILVNTTPNNDANAVSKTSNILFTFNEVVNAGAGNIVIHTYDDDGIFETISASTATGLGSTTITLDPVGVFDSNRQYYVLVEGNAFVDDNGNNYAGITNKNVFDFTTLDDVAPSLTASTPTDNDISVNGDVNIILNFDEAVQAQSGTLHIKRTADDSVFESFLVSSARITGSGTANIMILPTNDFESETEYYVQIDATAFDDLSGNSYAGITTTTALSFTTGDTKAPTIVTYDPAPATLDVALNSNLIITFDEFVNAGSGNISIHRMVDDVLVETIAASTATGLGTTTITIDPTSDLTNDTDYYVLINDDAFEDSNGNSFAGLTDKNIWYFSSPAGASIWETATPDLQSQIYPFYEEEYGEASRSACISGDWAVMGHATLDKHGSNAGGAYIYTFNGNSWDLHQELVPSYRAASNSFGGRVHCFGDMVFVSALLGDQSGIIKGDVFVFTVTDNVWNETQIINGENAGDSFGDDVHRKGNLLAISSGLNDNAGSNKGQIYLYTLSGGSWLYDSSLLTDGSLSLSSIIGRDLKIHDNLIITSAHGDDQFGNDSGAVVVFKKDLASGAWNQAQKITSPTPAAEDRFGVSLDYDGKTLAVYSDQVNNAGSIHIFEMDELGSFIHQTTLIASDAIPTDFMGFSGINVDQNTLIAGSYLDDTNGGGRGEVYIFTKQNGVWIETHKYQPDDLNDGNYFGQGFGYDGEKIIVGARFDDDKGNNVGAAYIITPDDQTNPYLLSSTPAHQSNGHAVEGDIILTFNENVTTQTGNIYLYGYDDDTLIETFAAGSVLITGTGTNEITINPTDDLVASTQYYIVIEDTVFDDTNSRSYAGLSDKNQFTFTTDYPASNWTGIDPVFQEMRFTNYPPVAEQKFGTGRVVINNEYAFFGRPEANSDAGSVTIFKLSENNNWNFHQEIIASDTAINKEFGTDVAVEGNVLVVGSQYDNVSPSSVYIFRKNSLGQWVETQRISTGVNNYGSTVSIDNGVIAVGAPGRLTNGLSNSGGIFVYNRVGSQWQQSQVFGADDAESSDLLGDVDLQIKGNVIIAIAYQDDDLGNNFGAFYEFTFVNGMWVQSQKFHLIAEPEYNSLNKARIAFNGETIIVGMSSVGNGGSDQGAAYILEKVNGQWTQIQRIVASAPKNGGRFGMCVDIHENSMIIGHPRGNTTFTSGGEVYIYTKTAGIWTKQSTPVLWGNEKNGTYFGEACALHDNIALVTAPQEDEGNLTNAGVAYIISPSDLTPPILTSSDPSDGQGSVNFYTNVILNFNDIVTVNIGDINVYEYDTDILFETIDVTSGRITGSGTTEIVIDPVAEFEIGKEYYVVIDQDAFINSGGLGYAGLSEKTDLNFDVDSNTSAWTNTAPYLDQKIVNYHDNVTSNGFALSVAIDGDLAIVGAYAEDYDGFTDAGAVYVYKRTDKQWSLLERLENPDPANGEMFGSNLDIDDSWIVISAFRDSAYTGAIYAYNYNGSSLTMNQKIAPVSSNHFGSAVGVNNDIIVASSRFENNAKGAVYVYQNISGIWTEIQKIEELDVADNSEFGFDIAIDNGFLAVGVLSNHPWVYTYEWDGSNFVFEEKIIPADPLATNSYGTFLTLSNNYMAVTDYNYDSVTGATFMYEHTGSGWVEQQVLVGRPGRLSMDGASLAIGQREAVIPAVTDDVVYLYTRAPDTGIWSEQSTAIPTDNIDNLYFGNGVGIDNHTLVVGSGHWQSPDKFRDQVWFYSAEPRIISSSPEKGSSSFGVNQDVILSFNKNVTISGNARLQIIQENNGSVAETVDLNGSNVSGNETNQITIDLSNDLIAGEDYYITLTDGAFLDDTAGTSEGYSGGDGFSFTTFKTSPWAGIQAVEIEKILAPTSVAGDRTGRQISIDGSYALSSSLSADNHGVDSGHAYIYVKNGDNWIIQQELVPSSIGAGSAFGSYSQLVGDFAFIGSEYDSGQGAVFVFKRSGDTWVEHQKLQASDGDAGDAFGHVLNTKDNQLVIGAQGDDDAGLDSGALYVFEFDGSNWIEKSKIVLMNPDSNYMIGNKVHISENIIVSADTDGNSSTGIAFIFEKSNGIWQQTKTLSPSELIANDRFGNTPLVKGNQVFLQTHRQDTFTGAVYVFEKINNDWIQKQKITAKDASINSSFGVSTSLYKNTLIIGAHQHDDGLTNAGKIYVFSQDIDGLWTEKSTFQSNVLNSDTLYGASTAIYDDYMLVSAWGNNENGTATGALYSYYNKPLNSNIVQNKIQSAPVVADARFSSSISFYGDYALIGAHKEDSNKGAAYIFKKTGESLTQTQKLKPNDLVSNDTFGFKTDLWTDYAAIAATSQNSEEGAVYIYKRDQETWNQIVKLSPPNIINGENFGSDISINNGYIIVGASGGSGKNGIAYLYEKDSGGTDNWGLIKTFVGSDSIANDLYGTSVTTYNNAIAISASNHGTSGAVYIYEKDFGGTDNWGEIKKITPSDGVSGDNFGADISMYDANIVVGSPSHDNGISNQGASYIFNKDQGGADNWGQTQKIYASDSVTDGVFGTSVSLQGITAIIGSPGALSNGLSNAGQAYEFNLINGLWTQTRILFAGDRGINDALGSTVDSYVGTYIVSSALEDTGEIDAGSAYVFYSGSPIIVSSTPVDNSSDNPNRTNITLTFDRAIIADSGSLYIRKISDNSIYETYSMTDSEVSVSGATLTIDRSAKTPLPSSTGFYVTIDNTAIKTGQNYFNGISDTTTFNFSTASVWLNAAAPNKAHTGYNPDSASESRFGSAGDVDGDWIAVASPFLNGSTNTLTDYRYGAVFLYNRNQGGTNNWGLVKTIRSPDPGAQDNFGYGNSISIENDWMTIGEGYSDDITTNAGAVHLYNKNQGGADNWGFVKTIYGSSIGTSDYFGVGAHMNDEMLFVTAPYDDDNGSNMGAGYIFAKDQGGIDNWGEVAKIYPDGLSQTQDWWGSISGTNMYIDKNIAVYGAFPWDDNGFLNTGRVYIYGKDQGGINNWGLIKTIDNPTPTYANDYFGIGIASNGDWLFVGAPHDNDLYGSRRGTIYAYRRDQGGVDNWGFVKALDNVVPDQSRYNGYSLQMAGDTLVSGAQLDNSTNPNILYSGAFIIYNRNEGGVDNWGQTHRIKPLSPSYNTRMGHMVAISDNEEDIIIGGHTASGSSGVDSGIAQIFNKNHGGTNNWGGIKDLTPHGVLSGRNWFGHGGISIDGNLVAVGAYRDSEAGANAGAAYIFDKNLGNEDSWELVKKILPPDNEVLLCGKFGAVALSNDMVLLGCENRDIITGRAFLYYKDFGGPNNWGLFKVFQDPSPNLSDHFGYSVDINGDFLAIAALYGDESASSAGDVHIYYRNLGGSDNWGLLKALSHSSASGSDTFGYSVSFSKDATRLIVGAAYDDDNGSNNGGAYVYYKDQGGIDNWGEVARLNYTDFSSATTNLCGTDVAIDGDYAVMGCAHYDLEDGDADTANEGKAFLFYKDAGGVDNWGQIKSIEPPSVPTTAYDVNDYFAWTVALENNTLFLGSYLGDLTVANAGDIFIYNKDQGGVDNWGEVTSFASSSSDYLRELSVDDGVIATAHTYEEDPGVTFNDIGGFSIWEAQ